MLEFVILAVFLYIIYSALSGNDDKKDEKRWPYLMEQERSILELSKTTKRPDLRTSLKKMANMMRKQRKDARKNEKLAKILDIKEAAVKKEYYQNSQQREMNHMHQTILNLEQKTRNLEREKWTWY